MENLSKMESFKSFQISRKSMNQIAGSRSVDFKYDDGPDSACVKIIDHNDGSETRKTKLRYMDKC